MFKFLELKNGNLLIDSLYSYYIDGAYLCEECMEDRYMVNTPVGR